MRKKSVKFNVDPSEYELFRFSITRPTTLYVQMIASSPVNLVLLDSESRAEYEQGKVGTKHPYAASWGRRVDLDAAVDIDEPGTWYLLVEGVSEPSHGRIIVYE